MNLLERTCDRCAQRAADCTVIDDAYVCGDCRAEIAAEGADRDALATMLKRLLDVALVDGFGETVRDEAETLLARLGGR